MSRLPLVTSKQLEKFLLNRGFIIKRQKGSHIFYKHPDGRYTTIPHHGNQVLGRSLIRQILREIQISIDEYIIYFNED
jgi:predicted RNA binding protein YcfA (HicA-like mRNA interferase family)